MAEGPPLHEPLLDSPSQESTPLPQQQALDCWGRPSSSSLGGWNASIFLIGANTFLCLAISGCTVNLVLFLVKVLRQDNATAANMITNWMGTTFITSLIGGSLGDAFLGRLWTSIICETLFVTGLVLYAFSGSLISHLPPSACIGLPDCSEISPPTLHVLLFYISIYMMGLGTASLAPNMLSLGADQFNRSKDKSTFINILMGSSNIGMLLSTTILSYWEDEGKWALGFWVSAGAGIMGFILFLVGMPRVRQFKPGQNPLMRIGRVLIAAVYNFEPKAPSQSNGLFKQQRRSLQWLDKASPPLTTRATSGDVEDHEEGQRKMKVCTADEVEEVKSMCRLMPFWLCGILVATALSQKGTLFVLQGATMDNRLGNLEIPPSSMGIFSLLTVVVGAPAYSWILLPCIRNVIGKEITSIHRMGAGLAIAITSLSTAAVVEAQRLRIANLRVNTSLDPSLDLVPMSILWLVPQYVLEGWTTVFFGFGHLEFNYTFAPKDMRSLSTALSLSGLALGSYLSSFVLHVITSTTNWIPKNLNNGHLDYFYWLLVAMLVFTSALYIAFAKVHAREILDDDVVNKVVENEEDMKINLV